MNKVDRPSPTAFVVSPYDTSLQCRRHRRIVVLSTGRGDSNISPDEAESLGKLLIRQAKLAKSLLGKIEHAEKTAGLKGEAKP